MSPMNRACSKSFGQLRISTRFKNDRVKFNKDCIPRPVLINNEETDPKTGNRENRWSVYAADF